MAETQAQKKAREARTLKRWRRMQSIKKRRAKSMADRCKHELVVGTCATCLGTDGVSVPDPFEGMTVDELDPEKDLEGR